jgi:acyl transferase domain-containing protein/phosphopantetheinyl transferase (holo-ACP synthase)
MSRGRPAEIAIVGMGCRFPGAADLSSYFENILAARECTRDVPRDRWDPAVFCDPIAPADDRVPSCRGGYLDSPLGFDAAEHGIMPRTVEGGEPEQFLVLDATVAALADAGLAAADLGGRRVEVVIGRGNYFNRGNLTRLQHGRMIAQTMSLLGGLFPEWSEGDREAIRQDLRASLPPFEAATIAGQLTNATAGRIANRLDLSGASYVVDAASASSLVALDLAMRALAAHRADLAIAGGVYVEADVDFPLVFRQLNALSGSGHARPFADGADGMVPGEGVGVAILKRRADAERDGDRIYALVQGVGLASDGRSQGLAAPSARGHARAIRRAYRRAGIDSSTVMLVEGHGLGVPAADRAELRALNATFPLPRYGRRSLGAVSSMIGHAMPAAGMAGLIKTALALFHRVLPPTLHAERPHALLKDAKSTFALNPSTRPWIHADPDAPRRAGVNAFGFAGINAHAVLEEHAASADGDAPGALKHWETEAILLSAPDRAGLVQRAGDLVRWIERNPREELIDVAYSLNTVSEHPSGSARLGLVASSVAELGERLKGLVPRLADTACSVIRDGRGVYYWDEPISSAGSLGLAFLFPGEGSQYPGMLADLCIHFPEVRRLFDTADRIARDQGETVPPSEHVFGQQERGDRELWSAATAVNIVLNAQWALYQVLTRLGLRPDAVVGHSSGELLALAAAGVFETDRALELKLGRLGAIFHGFECSGDLPAARLIAVAAHRDRIEALCRDAGSTGAAVAIDNCPHQVVLAVPPAEVAQILDRLRAENILWEDLPFSRAYHTASFRTVLGPIVDFFAELTFREPCVPIYSCAARGRMPESVDEVRELAVSQWTRPVAFRETIEAMHADGLRMFVDVGARGNLAGFVEDILRGKPAFAMAANMPRRSGLTQLNHLVAATFAQGALLETNYLYARRRPRAIEWDAPARTPRPLVELSLGFPEMRLSEDLVQRLRSARSTALSPQVPGPATDPHDDDPLPVTRSGQHHASRNGATGRDHVATPRTASLSPFEACLAEEVEAGRGAVREPSSRWPNRQVTYAEPGSELEAQDADGAMLSFQETMQAFLHTQHEIMSAYLGSTIDDDCGTTADLGGVPPAIRTGEPGPGMAGFPASQAFGEEAAPAAAGRDEAQHGAEWPSRATGVPITSGSTPGPWAGAVRRLVAGTEIETLLVIDSRDDPIAVNHTLGGRLVSAVDASLLGLPVLPFAVMAEMTAQVAALVVTPGLVLISINHVRAHKWVRYEEEPVHLELHGRREPSNGDVERVWVGIFNRGPGGIAEPRRPVFEGVVSFGESPPAPQPAGPWSLENARPSRFTARSVYQEQWLFHGPAFQAIVGFGAISEQGIEGTVRVLPLEPLLKTGGPARFHTDLIVIDTFTQLLGAWGLDELTEGDVVFPLSMEELEVLGGRPAPGTIVDCRITVKEIQRHRLLVQAEIIRPDGTIWMRISDWQDWRFHWPRRYRDVFRQPRDYFAGEELPLDDAGRSAAAEARAVWLEPPADMGRPVWRDVLEQTQLGPQERAGLPARAGSDRQRTLWLWGCIAVKEAARRLWQADGHAATYPADLAVVASGDERPRMMHVAGPGNPPLPAISIAHCDGIAVALAAVGAARRVGIAVTAINDRPESFLDTAFSPEERSRLDGWQGARRVEWLARFWSAKEAAAKAGGAGSADGPSRAKIVEFNGDSGVMLVELAPDAGGVPAKDGVDRFRVVSGRRGGFAWAWTLGEGAES